MKVTERNLINIFWDRSKQLSNNQISFSSVKKLLSLHGIFYQKNNTSDFPYVCDQVENSRSQILKFENVNYEMKNQKIKIFNSLISKI